MASFREKVVTDGRTNGRTNMGDLIGPNPTKVGGPKWRKSLEFPRKTENKPTINGGDSMGPAPTRSQVQ